MWCLTASIPVLGTGGVGSNPTMLIKKVEKNAGSMKKLLIQVPYFASTNNYGKYFPHPLLLLNIFEKGDTLLDLNLECFKSKKEGVYSKLDSCVKYIATSEFEEVVLNLGEFPPDADKHDTFLYFLKKVNEAKIRVSIQGVYPTLNGGLDSDFVTTKKTDFDVSSVIIPNDLLGQYPKVDGLLRASMKISYGCPRRCSMCPVVPIYNQTYRFNDAEKSAKIVEHYYEQGVRYITFTDDNLAVNTKRFKEFLTLLLNKNLKGLKLLCQEGFEVNSLVDEELVYLLKALKFDDVKVGVENIKADFLTRIDKCYIDPSKIDSVIQNAEKYKLDIRFLFLFDKFQSEEDVLDNLRYFSKNRISKFRVNVLRKYHDTKYSCDLSPKLSPNELKRLQALAYASAFITERFKDDLFSVTFEEFLSRHGYSRSEDNIFGKFNLGFIGTSRFLCALAYLAELHYGCSVSIIKTSATSAKISRA